jgi:hypothetical protein
MDPLAPGVHHDAMELLVVGLLVIVLSSLAVLFAGAVLASYRDRRSRRRLVRPGGDPGS